MSPGIRLHLGVYSKRQAASYPGFDATTRKLCNTHLPHTICKYNMQNAAQHARGSAPSQQNMQQTTVTTSTMCEHLLQPHSASQASDQQHLHTRNVYNIFNARIHAFPATFTLLPSLAWSHYLVPSSSHHTGRISISYPRPQPHFRRLVTSSQPLVASFDRTATALQTQRIMKVLQY
jgi:hypothetical protein